MQLAAFNFQIFDENILLINEAFEHVKLLLVEPAIEDDCFCLLNFGLELLLVPDDLGDAALMRSGGLKYSDEVIRIQKRS